MRDSAPPHLPCEPSAASAHSTRCRASSRTPDRDSRPLPARAGTRCAAAPRAADGTASGSGRAPLGVSAQLDPIAQMAAAFGQGAPSDEERLTAAQRVRCRRLGDFVLRARSAVAAWASSTKPADLARSPRRAQGAAVRGRARIAADCPLQERGPGRRAVAPSEHRAGVRRGLRAGRALLRDAVHRRPAAGPRDRRSAADAARLRRSSSARPPPRPRASATSIRRPSRRSSSTRF